MLALWLGSLAVFFFFISFTNSWQTIGLISSNFNGIYIFENRNKYL